MVGDSLEWGFEWEHQSPFVLGYYCIGVYGFSKIQEPNLESSLVQPNKFLPKTISIIIKENKMTNQNKVCEKVLRSFVDRINDGSRTILNSLQDSNQASIS